MKPGSRDSGAKRPANTPHSRKAPATPGRPLSPRKRLTKKRRALLLAWAKNPDATLEELAELSGFSDGTIVSRTLRLPEVVETMREIMDATAGLDRKKIAQRLAEGLDAMETKFFAHEGRVKDQRDCVDFPTRKAYIELVGRFRGELLDRKDVTSNGNTVKALILEDD